MLVLAPPIVWVEPYGLGQSSASLVQTAAANYPNVPNLAAIASAVMMEESGGIATAKNPNSTACGLFQMTSAAQQYENVTDCTDPTQNANAGVALLAMYYQTYGNWPDALQAFSEGAGNVGNPPMQQTINLINTVESSTGLDLSSAGSMLASLFPSLPDLSDFSISDALGLDAPDWLIWAGIGVLGAGIVVYLAQG